MKPEALNYDSNANVRMNNLCIQKREGCLDSNAHNYNEAFGYNVHVPADCIQTVYGCRSPGATNYDVLANDEDTLTTLPYTPDTTPAGICVPKVYGETDSRCSNYRSDATDQCDLSCPGPSEKCCSIAQPTWQDTANEVYISTNKASGCVVLGCRLCVGD